MLFPKLGTCQSADKGNRCLAFLRPPAVCTPAISCFSGLTLVYHVENLLAAGFRSHVYHFQTVSARKFFQALPRLFLKASLTRVRRLLLFHTPENSSRCTLRIVSSLWFARQSASPSQRKILSTLRYCCSCPRKVLQYFLRFSYVELLRLDTYCKTCICYVNIRS